MQSNKKKKMGKKPINIMTIVIIIMMTIYVAGEIWTAIKDSKPTEGTMSYNQIFEELEKDTILNINVTKNSDKCQIFMKDGTVYDAINPQSDTFIEDLMMAGAEVKVVKKSFSEALLSIFISIPMIAIMALVAAYMSKLLLSTNTKMFTLVNPKDNHTSFDDVRGVSETKKEVKFAIEQLKQHTKLASLGARPCKGMLLYGPPGTGKTLIAKAIANEAGVPFVSASGSDFNEMFVGVGASRVRALWDLALANAPCILFIDEIDCIGKRRRGGDGASSEYNQTINSLLQKMDGLNPNSGVLVIGATNMKESLDKALLRPGRFDRQYFIGPPRTKKDRDDIVELYLENKKLDKEVTLDTASKLLAGLTGAEVEEALNEAVHISLSDDRDGTIKLSDIDEAIMKMHTSGVKQEHSSSRDTEIVAIHEAGHTVVSLLFNIDIAKVSIVPYSSGTGGVTMRDMDKHQDEHLRLKSEIEADICVLLAGKVAEQIKYHEHTPGCSNDIEKATSLVYQMVTEWGYGKTLFNENTLINMGVNHIIEENVVNECNSLLEEYNKRTVKMLTENFELVEKISARLIAEKTIVSPTLEDFKEA